MSTSLDNNFSETLDLSWIGSMGDMSRNRLRYLFHCFLLAMIVTGYLYPSSKGHSLDVLFHTANRSGI